MHFECTHAVHTYVGQRKTLGSGLFFPPCLWQSHSLLLCAPGWLAFELLHSPIPALISLQGYRCVQHCLALYGLWVFKLRSSSYACAALPLSHLSGSRKGWLQPAIVGPGNPSKSHAMKVWSLAPIEKCWEHYECVATLPDEGHRGGWVSVPLKVVLGSQHPSLFLCLCF